MGITAHENDVFHGNGFVIDLEANPNLHDLAYDSSGGDPAIFFSNASGEQRELFFLRDITDSTEAETALQLGFADSLEQIRETFGLNRSELATVCGSSRKTLYDWQKGSRPRKKSMKRIEQLRRAAMDWRRSGFRKPTYALLHTPIVQESSLYDLLKSDSLSLEAIHFAGSRINMYENQDQIASLSDPFAISV